MTLPKVFLSDEHFPTNIRNANIDVSMLAGDDAEDKKASTDDKPTGDSPDKSGPLRARRYILVPESEDEGSDEENDDNVWNAFATVGLRVYSQSKGVTIEVIRPKKAMKKVLLDPDDAAVDVSKSDEEKEKDKKDAEDDKDAEINKEKRDDADDSEKKKDDTENSKIKDEKEQTDAAVDKEREEEKESDNSAKKLDDKTNKEESTGPAIYFNET